MVVGEESPREPGGVHFAPMGWELDQGVLRGPLMSSGFQTSLLSLYQPQPAKGRMCWT